MRNSVIITRRQWLASAAATAVWSGLPRPAGAQPAAEPLPVAAAVTVYRKNTHADVIVGKILEGYLQNGGPGPGLKLVSLYVDQLPADDLSRPMAEKHGFRLAATIDEAITLGTDRVRVAGVLSIAEHGDYPDTPDTHQKQYPRRRFFEEIAATFHRCGQVVPVFNDKHLSYRWQDAKFMFDKAREMKIPLLAGSSVPVGWRQPALEVPLGAEIEAAVGIGYGGAEGYGFHALEGLASFIERRKGGETGVSKVRVVTGDEIRRSQMAGQWSGDLFAAALRTLPRSPVDSDKWIKRNSSVFLMEHRDGLKSAVVMANGLVGDFACAVKIKDRAEPMAVRFQLQENVPFGHFAYLLHAFEHTLRTGKAAYPVERTLFTTGVLDRAMQSLASGETLNTPELEFAYTPADWPFANRQDSTLKLKID